MNPQEEKTQAPETPATEPQSSNMQITTPQSSEAQTTTPQNPTPQPQVVEGKKSHAWIIVLVIVLLLIAALIGAIIWTSSVFFKAAGKVSNSVLDEIDKEIGTGGQSEKPSNTKSDSNPIIDANNKMRNELQSFDYTATITSFAMDMALDTTMNCTFDGKNKIEYCKNEVAMGLTQEVYYDWGNGYEYTKSVSPYSFVQIDEGWTKTALPQGTTGAVNIADGTSFTDIASESVENGTKYTGTISGFEADGGSESNASIASDMDYTIIVNNDGYIETMTMEMSAMNMRQSVEVEYSNFGTAQSLSIPEEALNAE